MLSFYRAGQQRERESLLGSLRLLLSRVLSIYKYMSLLQFVCLFIGPPLPSPAPVIVLVLALVAQSQSVKTIGTSFQGGETLNDFHQSSDYYNNTMIFIAWSQLITCTIKHTHILHTLIICIQPNLLPIKTCSGSVDWHDLRASPTTSSRTILD